MRLALIIFFAVYILMLIFPKERATTALCGAGAFIILGVSGIFDYSVYEAFGQIDLNILMMLFGTMGLVSLFVKSKMPARISEEIIKRAPNVRWAITLLALFAGIISAFVDNVATVLMIAPVGISMSKKFGISPVPAVIAIAVSSNLQGAATLVGDTTSILLGGFADMTFSDFFFLDGRPGIFWAVELGAAASVGVLLFIFRKEKQSVSTVGKTEVSDLFPTFLILSCVLLLIASSFIPRLYGKFETLYGLRCGLICVLLCVVGVVRECLKKKSFGPVFSVAAELDFDTLILLTGLFVIVGGVKASGAVDAVAELFLLFAGENLFVAYTLTVFLSVVFSAFIDNIPYVATMLPVVGSLSAMLGGGEKVLAFGLLIGATLGGNLTPVGASANIAAIGILQKNGYAVGNRDFLKIGVPITVAAVLSGYVFIWLTWGGV